MCIRDSPYVVNGPVAALFSAAIGGSAAAQLVIGLVLTLVSYFLTPKPKPPKTPPSLTTAGQQGVRRFAPQTGFDTAQELAELGAVIPLVFAKYRKVNNVDLGGIRVNTQLLWSQMRSLGKGQQIKAIFNLSSGELGQNPDFNGYAIGDILLKNYSEWEFLPTEDLNRKTIEIYIDLKIAKRFCNKEQKVIKVPNTNVFKIVAPILLNKGISRIVSADKLISL